jgi:8-oxo-dGTP pyrophosphatase MutT (NUDIX family)
MAENYDGVIGIIFQRSNPVKYILIHNKKTGNVTFPGGGRDEGEVSSKESLEREVREETGLLPSEYRIIETPIIHEFVYNSKKKERAGQTARQPVYLVETSKNDLNPEDPDSIIDGWYTAEEVINKLTFSDSKELFKKSIKYI